MLVEAYKVCWDIMMKEKSQENVLMVISIFSERNASSFGVPFIKYNKRRNLSDT